MSYDLSVFNSSAAPKKRNELLSWFENQDTASDRAYDHTQCSSELQNWFKEMIEFFPPLNGPLKVGEDDDRDVITDYNFSENLVYACFAWSVAESAKVKARELATKNGVGFFDVSSENGEIIFPDGRLAKENSSSGGILGSLKRLAGVREKSDSSLPMKSGEEDMIRSISNLITEGAPSALEVKIHRGADSLLVEIVAPKASYGSILKKVMCQKAEVKEVVKRYHPGKVTFEVTEK